MDVAYWYLLHPSDCGTMRYASVKTVRSMSQLVRWVSTILDGTLPVCEELAEWCVFLLAHNASVSVSAAAPAALGASGLKLV